jgi:large subunit ribosomal protein L35
MPKMKTNRGAKKRFSRTATGKIRRNHSMHRHILTKKSPKRKRRLRQTTLLAPADMKRVRRMLAGS